MNAAAGTCGHPFCDQMVLEAAGGIYWAEDIVLASKPPSPLIDDSCGLSRRTASSPATKKGGKRGASKPDGALAGPKVKIARMGESEPTLHSGDAWIYFGPMSINSRVHDVKTTHGGLGGEGSGAGAASTSCRIPCGGVHIAMAAAVFLMWCGGCITKLGTQRCNLPETGLGTCGSQIPATSGPWAPSFSICISTKCVSPQVGDVVGYHARHAHLSEPLLALAVLRRLTCQLTLAVCLAAVLQVGLSMCMATSWVTPSVMQMLRASTSWTP
jgi:hypothetical protein